jgi:hypothetical protein
MICGIWHWIWNVSAQDELIPQITQITLNQFLGIGHHSFDDALIPTRATVINEDHNVAPCQNSISGTTLRPSIKQYACPAMHPYRNLGSLV